MHPGSQESTKFHEFKSTNFISSCGVKIKFKSMLQGSELIESLIGIFNSDKLLTLVMATISHVVRRNRQPPSGKKNITSLKLSKRVLLLGAVLAGGRRHPRSLNWTTQVGSAAHRNLGPERSVILSFLLSGG